MFHKYYENLVNPLCIKVTLMFYLSQVPYVYIMISIY